MWGEMWSGPNVRKVQLRRKCDTSSMALCACLTPAFLPLNPTRLLRRTRTHPHPPTLLNDGIMSLSPTLFAPREKLPYTTRPNIFHISTIAVLVLVGQGCHRKWKSILQAFLDSEIYLQTCRLGWCADAGRETASVCKCADRSEDCEAWLATFNCLGDASANMKIHPIRINFLNSLFNINWVELNLILLKPCLVAFSYSGIYSRWIFPLQNVIFFTFNL